jgi:hypothetical protein
MISDRFPPPDGPLSFLILGQRIQFECLDLSLRRLVFANFGMMATAGDWNPSDLHYRGTSGHVAGSFSLIRDGQAPLDAADACDFLYLLEKDITVELQRRRSNLFFLHSAAIDWRGKACLFAAEPGSGKSTTTWAMLHHEFRYLSDELSPIDLETMQVFPYPHALCLKQRPPQSYPLPLEAIDLGRTIHVPPQALPAGTISESRPLGAVFLVKYHPELATPEMRQISPAEASARLYANTLNALAHDNRGLDAVVRIAEHVPCFIVSSAELRATAMMIRSTIEQVVV